MSRFAFTMLAMSGILAGPSTLSAQDVDETPAPSFHSFSLPGQALVQLERKNRVNEAIEQLKAAESNKDRADATDQLRKALAEEYDKLMEQEEGKLTKLEERLNNLRDQLRRRRAAKQQMVDLRMQVLVSESEGLGWPQGHEHPHHFFGTTEVWTPEPPEAPAAREAPPGVGLAR